MHKRKALLSLALAAALLSLLAAGYSASDVELRQPKAKAGVLDLASSKLSERVVRLDGQWELYWEQLLTPQDFKRMSPPQTGYIDVPGSWNHYIVDGRELSGEGYATYRLLFETTGGGRLGLKVPRVFTSYRLWVNGELVASAGTVGQSKAAVIPQYLPQVALFDPQTGTNEIVMQLSNFYHRSGGLLESLLIGSEGLVTGLRDRRIAGELFLFGSLFVIGAYHLALFLYRRTNKSAFYFGTFCLLVGIRTLLLGERFLIYLYPGFSWELAHKLQTLAFYLGVPIIVMFFQSVFPARFHASVVRLVQGVAGAFAAIVLFTNARAFTVVNPAYQLFTLLVMVYTLYALVQALLHKDVGVKLIMMGALAIIITTLNDMVFLSIWMSDSGSPQLRSIFTTGNLSSVGQLIFVFANALVLAQRFSTALEQEEVMTAQLKVLNAGLDELVTERTKALEQSKKEIEQQKLELEEANRVLNLISLKDPLTDLWNRRHYDNVIKLEWNRALRHGTPISLLLLDVDDFKAYNDTYGHQAGDNCLIQVAQIMHSLFNRASDLVARFGGEEFIVALPGLSRDEAMQMAAVLQQTIEEMRLRHEYSSVSPWVTVSIGVTSRIPSRDSTPRDLFLTVDQALYQAKAAGKNQVKFLP